MGMRRSNRAISEVPWKMAACDVTSWARPASGHLRQRVGDAVATALELAGSDPNAGWPMARFHTRGASEDLANGHPRIATREGRDAAGSNFASGNGARTKSELSRVYLAAVRQLHQPRQRAADGLLIFLKSKYQPAGNTALLGAKLALFQPAQSQRRILGVAEENFATVSLPGPEFQETYVEQMTFQKSR